jgi:hypothetical protein
MEGIVKREGYKTSFVESLLRRKPLEAKTQARINSRFPSFVPSLTLQILIDQNRNVETILWSPFSVQNLFISFWEKSDN